MFRFLATAWMIGMGSAAMAGSPIAEVFCDDRDSLLLKLERSYGAERMGRGMRGPEAVIEVWAVQSTGEWTLVQSYPDGRSCIVAMGENWEAMGFAQALDPA
jgi:hypothetical protein